MAARDRNTARAAQGDLFSASGAFQPGHALDRFGWPAQDVFPVNRASAHVRQVLWADLAGSPAPLIVAGFSSIAEQERLAADWEPRDHRPGQIRLLLGNEPFSTTIASLGSPRALFIAEVRRYWLGERGVSLRLSAKVIAAIAALDRGAMVCRFFPHLHAKLYVGDTAATVGSSNFTVAGLAAQVEANTRFTADPAERSRYQQLRTVAENYWATGEPWDAELRALLETLLQVVT